MGESGPLASSLCRATSPVTRDAAGRPHRSRLSLNLFLQFRLPRPPARQDRGWLTLTAEKVPRTCLRSCWMMLDPYHYLQGKSNVKTCVPRRGVELGTPDWADSPPRFQPLEDRSQKSPWPGEPAQEKPPTVGACADTAQQGGGGRPAVGPGPQSLYSLITHSNVNIY